MFSGLTKSKFYTKCKSLTKMTRIRIDALKKKKSTVVKYLKNDIIELLRGGHDYNAYGRVEGLIIEQNVIICYNYIEEFCGCISSNLSAMNKQKECPTECREAVQSLIYAAARYAEIPELRELRTVFTERYGSSLESYIKKEFVEILRTKHITKEIKIQVLHEIAEENLIQWDSKSLEQKLFNPALQDQLRQGSLNKDNVDGYKLKMSEEDQNARKGYKLSENKGDIGVEVKVDGVRLDTTREKCKRGLVNHVRKNSIDDKLELSSSSEDDTFSSHWSTDRDSLRANSSSVGSVSEDELDSKKPLSFQFIPPPYIRSNERKEKNKTEELPKSNSPAAADDSSVLDTEAKPKPRSVRRRKLKPPPADEDPENIARLLKLPPGREKVVGVGRKQFTTADSGTMTHEGITQRITQRGLRMLLPDAEAAQQGDPSREEEIIDELLLHYSNKPHPDRNNPTNCKIRSTKSDGVEPISGDPDTASTGETKRHTRAISLQPEALAGHVHPNLPDYSELVARIAALKRR